MKNPKLTAVHVRSFTGLSRTELQRLLNTIPPFSSSHTQARRARVFSIKDLAFLKIISYLINEVGFGQTQISSFSSLLYQKLGSPASHDDTAEIKLCLTTEGKWEVASIDSKFNFEIETKSTWRELNAFLHLDEPSVQHVLPFGLSAVRSQIKERA